MSGDIVDAIDRAVADYALSRDAMRWTPDVPEDEIAVVREHWPNPAVWDRAAAAPPNWLSPDIMYRPALDLTIP